MKTFREVTVLMRLSLKEEARERGQGGGERKGLGEEEEGEDR